MEAIFLNGIESLNATIDYIERQNMNILNVITEDYPELLVFIQQVREFIQMLKEQEQMNEQLIHAFYDFLDINIVYKDYNNLRFRNEIRELGEMFLDAINDFGRTYQQKFRL